MMNGTAERIQKRRKTEMNLLIEWRTVENDGN